MARRSTTYRGDFEMCDIERAARDGKLAYEGAPREVVSRISQPTKTMIERLSGRPGSCLIVCLWGPAGAHGSVETCESQDGSLSTAAVRPALPLLPPRSIPPLPP